MGSVERTWWKDALRDADEARWFHVYGPAGIGKTTCFDALQASLEARGDAQVVRVRAHGYPMDPAKIFELAELAPPVDPAAGFWAALAELPTIAAAPVYLLIEDVDDWLFDEEAYASLAAGFRESWAGLSDNIHLVTSSTFEITALGRVRGVFNTSLPPSFRETRVPEFESEGAEYAALVLPLKAAFGDDAQTIVSEVLKVSAGHPGMTFRLLDAILNGEPFPRTKNYIAPLIGNAQRALRQYPELLITDLYPWDEVPIRTAAQARMMIAALEFFLNGPKEPGVLASSAASFCHSLNLVVSQAIEYFSAPTLAVGKGKHFRVPYLDWVRIGDETLLENRLKEIRGEVVDRLQREEDERKQEDDPVVQRVRDIVELNFCKTDRGMARQTKIEGRVKTIIEGKLYSATLASHEEADVTEARAKGEEVTREPSIRDSLRLFFGIPAEYRDLWQREFNILRQISAMGTAALPNIHENGILVEATDGEHSFGYILIENEGFDRNDHLREYFTAPENRSRVVREVRSLVQGLVAMQKVGVVHRLINPQTLRWHERGDYRQLSFGGFELVTSAYVIDELSEGAGLKVVSARHLSEVVGGRRNRIFFEPAAQYLFFNDLNAGATSFMPQGDVFSLCMTLCHLFYGSPASADIEAFEAADSGVEAEAALNALIANYKADIRDGPTVTVSPTLREILLSGLESDTARRPTGIDLMTDIIRKGNELYLEYEPDAKQTYILTYNSELTLRELARNLRYLLDFDPDRPDAPARLQDFLEKQLRSAANMFWDPNGYSRFVPDSSHRNPDHDKAQIVIASGRELNFYCDFAGGDYGLPESNGRVLMLRYTLDRRNHALAGLVARDFSSEFPDQAFRLVTTDSSHLRENNLEALAKEGTTVGRWNRLMGPKLESPVPLHLQAAYDALQFVTELEYQERELIKFPVYVDRSTDGGFFCHIVLDEARFNITSTRDPYRDLLFYDKRLRPDDFFRISLMDWLERHGEMGNDRICFQKTGTDTNIELPITAYDIQRGFIAIRKRINDLEGEGRLTFTDDSGVRSLRAARQEALGNLRFNSAVLEQLDHPRPKMALSRKKPDGLFEDLKGGAAGIVWNMINATPIFLLQGPPGTGKTRSLTESLHHVLVNEEPSARFLVTAQSHASVDTTLLRIAETMRAKEHDAANRFHMIRYLPVQDPDRVSQEVRSKYSIESVVSSVMGRIRATAEEEFDTLESEASTPAVELRRAALGLLKSAPDEAYDEIERRVQRNASMHFTTTSAVRADTFSMFGLESKFHTAVVEEASKVWGAAMIQPLILAHKGILIGDHKQIGPFDATRFNRLAVMACGGDPEDGGPEYRSREAEPIFKQYRDNPYAMVDWMETFRRIFEKYEKHELNQVAGGVRMADMLGTQFRSTREIGDLVSETFYEGKVKYGGAEFDPERALFDLAELGATNPSLVWLSTERLNTTYLHVQRGDGKIVNPGEVNTVARLLAYYRTRSKIVDPQVDKEVPIHERLLILAPYRSQIENLVQTLGDDPSRYGFSSDRDEALLQIRACCTSIDAAQGMEADTVIVSLVRSVDAEDRDYPGHDDVTSAGDWNIAIRRNFGFLTEPERVNVMLSRARQQLICVGNFDHFNSIADVVDDWANSHGPGTQRALAIRDQQGYWARLTGFLKQREGAIIDLSHVGGERLV